MICFSAIFSFLFFASCGDSTNNKLIIGKWQGAEWLANGVPSDLNAAGTVFIFDNKEKYSFIYGGTTEEGTYKVENDMLFTKPAEGSEIMVKIAKLTTDSLVFDMNRGGGSERLTLVRR
ncbi:MAG: lipocalin family protein [Ferruginibacter sp.]